MTGPRHLWSGDWREESAAAAAERAGRTTPPPPEAAPESQPPEPPRPAPARRDPPPPKSSARPRPSASRPPRPQRALRIRRGLVAAGALFLLAAAVAFGVTSVLADSDGSPTPTTAPAQASRPAGSPRAGRPWFGVDLAGFSAGNGALIGDVTPGSPADEAGLQPGDVISRIGSQQINQPVDVDMAIAGLHPGSKVQVVFLRGANTYTTTVIVGKAPAGYP